MRLLFDTHAFLWYISGSPRLTATLLPVLRAPANELLLSVVSVWEMSIKHQLGKLPLPQAPGTYLPIQRHRHRIASLDLDEASITHLAGLPLLHKDPFDRMLVCQALHHGLTLVTLDHALRAYSAYTHVAMLP